MSKGLASRALAGYPDVAEATRERVARLAADLGYRASARARALASGRNTPARCVVASLGIPSAALAQSIYGPVLTGIAAQAAAAELEIHLVALAGPREGAAAMLSRLIAEDRADGVVLLTFFPLVPDDVHPLEEARMPYVLTNRHFGPYPVNCVTPDWAGATRTAVGHLHALGHRRLALLLPAGAGSTIHDHTAGWAEAISRHGIPLADAPILRFAGHEASSAYEVVRRALTQWNQNRAASPTALVCMNDHYAHSVLTAADELGVRIPDDLSVIGFDDSIAPYTKPALCSFDPHLYEVGTRATTLLAEVLRDPATPRRRVLTPLDFVARASCSPPPAGQG